MAERLSRGALALGRLVRPAPARVTRARLAAVLGVSEQTISNWIRGHHVPPLVAATEIEVRYGIRAKAWTREGAQ